MKIVTVYCILLVESFHLIEEVEQKYILDAPFCTSFQLRLEIVHGEQYSTVVKPFHFLLYIYQNLFQSSKHLKKSFFVMLFSSSFHAGPQPLFKWWFDDWTILSGTLFVAHISSAFCEHFVTSTKTVVLVQGSFTICHS